ncbi:putative hemolysin [Thermocatellispora tengchongensis]|uniref:Putative hemolysin n=1 Tax=Thermocatellispora tengchongensis TaxID=1073253 RepID=A0A840PIM7_9ACTN|nr:GNAT family N-acyltransferase [Thermocatellispora tengchongensis]MBB5137661.1 putative hemolysin [Thermocatellispora tengchongensis]
MTITPSPVTRRAAAGSAAIADPRGRYTVSLAQTAADVLDAQRLRYQVFAGEMGARLDTPMTGVDGDRFDAYCDHLLVRESATGQVVGTYRLLAPGRSDRLYSETEFDLGPLSGIRKGLVEVGRSCVHAEHRGGAVVGLMWAGIARYMVEGGYSWLGGCCSVPLTDEPLAAAVHDRVMTRHLAPQAYRLVPHRPWSPEGIERPDGFQMPALLRGYLRLGSWVCGPPAYDPDFHSADFFVLLSLANVDTRYLRHFLGVES